MNAENQDQDFAKLQHLLKLKRYEIPPPRYFNDFSSQVVTRIRGGNRGLSYATAGNASWWQRLWLSLEGRPGVSGAAVASVCGLMIGGLFLAESTPQTPHLFAVGGAGEAAEGNDLAPVAAVPESFGAMPQLVSTTNLTTLPPALPSLFNTMPSLQTAPASVSLMPR